MIYRTSSTSNRKGIYFKNLYRGQRIGDYTPGKNAQITLCLPVETILLTQTLSLASQILHIMLAMDHCLC